MEEQAPFPWRRLLDECAAHIPDTWKNQARHTSRPHSALSSEPPSEHERLLPLLFSGNLQESIPHKLMQDSRLTPLERNAWIVFRMAMDRRGQSATSPRYKDLQPCISMVAGGKASMKTVAKVIANLRLTRWLTLLERGRDERTGQLKSSVYILHDEPLTLEEVLQIDANYVEYAANCIEHNDKGVRLLAAQALMELTQVQDRLPSRMQTLVARLSEQLRHTPYQMSHEPTLNPYQKPTHSPASAPTSAAEAGTEEGKKRPKNPSSATEESKKPPASDPSSAAEAGLKPSQSGLLPQRKQALENVQSFSTVCKNKHTALVRTKAKAVPDKTEHRENFSATEPIAWPEVLSSAIKENDRRSLGHELLAFAPNVVSELLETTATGWQNGKVQTPVAYLRGLIKRAENGQFKSMAARSQQTHASPPQTAKVPIFSVQNQDDEEEACSAEQAAVYRAQIRNLFKPMPAMTPI